jgi:hypothetical protein
MVKMFGRIKMESQKLSALNSISPNIKDVSQKNRTSENRFEKLIS